MMIGWGGKDFRWDGKVRCNSCGDMVRCNSTAKNHPSARPCLEGRFVNFTQSDKKLYLTFDAEFDF